MDVRLENFTVMPSTGPVIHAWIRNRTGQPLEATVRARWPQGWKVQPPPPVSLPPGATAKAAFSVEQAADVAANLYPVTLEVEAAGKTVRSPQQVLVATAPYLKPTIDGNLEDWQDAVPIEFETAGKVSAVMTCWNRGQFCLAVRVEEEVPGPSPDALRLDAIQFALTPFRAGATVEAAGKSQRYEFVVPVPAEGPAQGFLLMRPSDELSLAGQVRRLDGMPCPAVQAAVTRSGNVTLYEVAVPMQLMPELRATPGRAFGFSLLVHDAGGTGLGDLGSVMRLWPDQRDPLAWCRWEGASFDAEPPFNSSVEFGFSSSIH